MDNEKRRFTNLVIEELFRRKSVRVFTQEPVSQDEKRLILESACQAPTAGNQQLYTIIDVTDQNLKDRLAVTCDDQPFIAKAPLVLVFCADASKWYRAYQNAGLAPRKPGPGDLFLAMADTVIAAQNAVTAAESLGIGSCYIGDILENCSEHRRLLHLPAYVVPAAMVVFGYPTSQQKERKKPERASLKFIVHENQYREMGKEELQEMLEPQAGQIPYEQWINAFCSRKYMSDFSREMSRSAEEYLKDFLGGENS